MVINPAQSKTGLFYGQAYSLAVILAHVFPNLKDFQKQASEIVGQIRMLLAVSLFKKFLFFVVNLSVMWVASFAQQQSMLAKHLVNTLN